MHNLSVQQSVKVLGYLAISYLLVACGASQYAPVQELGYSLGSSRAASSRGVQVAPASYKIKSGDTLFAIAWRFGWDYKKLAKANNIRSPYTIYVGQKVYFKAVSDNNDVNNNKKQSSASKPVVSSVSSSKKVVKNKSKSLNNNQNMGSGGVSWSWPLQGKVVQKFTNKGAVSHGIDLSVAHGKTVKAASSGIIVYAGSGIQGYGNLVVVKHNDTFLSAYAYNSRILVAEGTKVSRGQAIAEVGKGPQLDPRLHFEIRKDGKPVNPLWYLPKL